LWFFEFGFIVGGCVMCVGVVGVQYQFGEVVDYFLILCC